MKIALGTTSDEKINILTKILTLFNIYPDIYPKKVESLVSEQPLSEDETIRGAKNRAMNAFNAQLDADISIGLEGGLDLVDNLYYLVCVAVIYKKNDDYIIGVSSKLALPITVSDQIKNGQLFGQVIRSYREQCCDAHLISMVDKLTTRENAFTEAIKNALEVFVAVKN